MLRSFSTTIPPISLIQSTAMNVGFLLLDFPIYLSMEKICCMATKIMRRCRLGIGSDCLLNSLGSFVSFHFLSLFCGMAFLTPG